MIDTLIHIALTFMFPPLLLGVINKTKAWFAGRKGAPFLQPYYDIAKLFRKGLVVSETTTWVFQAGPVITLAAMAMASLLIPLGRSVALVSFSGDFILFAYLFALSRFFTVSAALDTGSAFEGMGSSREVTFAVLSEPALFFAFLAFSRLSGALSLSPMLRGISIVSPPGAIASIVLLAVGLFIVLLAETCRIPVDDPNTHLELTMIHEVMVLDHSGPWLGTILYSSALKLFILGSILLNVVFPFDSGSTWLDWAYFVTGMLALAVIIGILESGMARLRMRRVPYLLVAAFLLCGSALILLLR